MCISPLTSLMMDQRAKYTPRGLQVKFVGEEQKDQSASTEGEGTSWFTSVLKVQYPMLCIGNVTNKSIQRTVSSTGGR